MTTKVEEQMLDAGSEVVVETVFGSYRGLLAQPHVKGHDVRLRCLGHDMWLHRRSVYSVRGVNSIVALPDAQD